jgi:spore coat protein A
MQNKISLLMALALAAIVTTANANVIALNPSKDNTLYEDPDGALSSGAGTRFFAGLSNEGKVRRGVIAFDVAAAIPGGSVVNSVTLTLYNSKTISGPQNVALHRLLADWGEGSSDASPLEGQGAEAAAGDATWKHRFYSTTLWSNLGGDFNATASATTSVGGVEYYSWSSAMMVADVQAWVNNPGANFGWLVKGNEGTVQTTKRFESRESGIAGVQPVLTVDFTPPGELGGCILTNGNCAQLTSNQCFAVNGTFLGLGSNCPPSIGACCLPDGGCTNLTAAECAALSGVYLGDNVACSSNLCPLILTPFVDALPVPVPLQPVTGSVGGTAYYEIPMRQVQQKLHRDLPLTTVWAYGNAFPGPVIEAGVGQPVTVLWTNDLRDASGNLRTNHYLPVDLCLHGPDMLGATARTVVHLHGGKVSPENDGQPEDTFLPGQSQTNYYPNNQPPGTLWFHDHALGITRLNVYMGLAGLYLLRDEFENSLGLPAGANEIPLILQDRTFNSDGSLSYPAAWEEHFVGDKIVVNGKVWPYLIVRQGKYRFRVLNGSTSRTYTLALSTGAAFHQIGTDAALLAAPVPLNEVTLMPAERADVVVDFAGYTNGAEILLTNSAPAPYPGSAGAGVVPNVLKFIVTNAVGHTAALPATLRSVDALSETNAVQHREFSLRKSNDACNGFKWLINDLGWEDITEFPVLGTTEVWSFINRSGVAHPMHLHLVHFQILDRQEFQVTNDVIVPVGPVILPPPNEVGWKDTVRVNPFEITRVIARFDGFLGRYPYHCHMLEHEDHEMMRQFEILPPPAFTSIKWLGSHASLTFTTTSNRVHAVERNDDLSSLEWKTVTNGIPGDGGIVTVIDPYAANSGHRFYRVRLNPDLLLTSTGTNNSAMIPDYSINLATANWYALTMQTNRFNSGTIEAFCGPPPGNDGILRIRATQKIP